MCEREIYTYRDLKRKSYQSIHTPPLITPQRDRDRQIETERYSDKQRKTERDRDSSVEKEREI